MQPCIREATTRGARHRQRCVVHAHNPTTAPSHPILFFPFRVAYHQRADPHLPSPSPTTGKFKGPIDASSARVGAARQTIAYMATQLCEDNSWSFGTTAQLAHGSNQRANRPQVDHVPEQCRQRCRTQRSMYCSSLDRCKEVREGSHCPPPLPGRAARPSRAPRWRSASLGTLTLVMLLRLCHFSLCLSSAISF
ncbi:hypothetical protein BC826DRAFT_82495 [Russula brevipes]|nr:hypothetical protein BC826DRAFT_82495 [Russula brevipes]